MAMQVSLARALHAKERAATYQAQDAEGNPLNMPAHGSDFKTTTTFESMLRWKNKDAKRGEKWDAKIAQLSEFFLVRIKTGKAVYRMVKQDDGTFQIDNLYSSL